MYQFTPRLTFVRILEQNRPAAVAWVTGNSTYSELSGLVKFYDTPYDGVLVEAEVFGLPNVSTQVSSDFYAMHIHQYGNCSGSFEKTGSHFNPTNAFHPEHAGDMIPLLGNQGYAWASFYDKSVVIHSRRDDFTSQPAGDSGEKIGCGVIRKED